MDTQKLVEDYKKLEEAVSAAKEKIADLEREKTVSHSRGEADERRLMRQFGVSDVKSLLEINTAAPRFAHVATNDKLAVMELKKEIDVARWYAQIFDGAPCDRGELEKNQVVSVKNILETGLAKNMDLRGKLKAFGTGVSGSGLDWIETAVSSQYIEEYLLEKRVANMFQEIPMSTNPFKLPVQKNGAVAKIVAEGAAASESTFGTDALTFDANYKFVELYNLPEELNEDSAVAILGIGRAQIVEAQLKALETAIINGDTTGTHMDSDVTAASDARKAWMGLRKLALANSANGSVVTFTSSASKTKLDEMIAAGGKFFINPREAMFVVSPEVYHQMTALDEVTTVDKFGPMATILTGILAAYRGRGIVVSEYMRSDLNASGVYDGVTTNNSGILLVNKSRFYIGRRRPIRTRVAQDARAEYDRWQLVSYQRADFQGMTQSATEVSAVYGIDVTV